MLFENLVSMIGKELTLQTCETACVRWVGGVYYKPVKCVVVCCGRGGPQAQHGVGTVSLTNSSPTNYRNDGNGLLGYLESTTAVSCRIAMPTGMESTLDPVLLLASVAVEFSVMINC